MRRMIVGHNRVIVLALLGVVAWFSLSQPPLILRNVVYRVYRQAIHLSIAREVNDLSIVNSQRATVYYASGDRNAAELIARLMDEYAPLVDEQYGFTNTRPTKIIVYPSRRSLAASMGWGSGDSALGVYWGSSIKLLSPHVWLAGKTPIEIEQLYTTKGPVAHEYTHLVIDYLTNGNIPRWLNEGLAQIEEKRLIGYQWLESGSVITGDNLYPLEQMDARFDKLGNQALAYHQSYTMALYLYETGGQSKINLLLRELGAGFTLDQSLHRVYGFSLHQYQVDWLEWLFEVYLPGAS